MSIEYEVKDAVFANGYNTAIDEFNKKKLIIIEGYLYLLTDFQYRKMKKIMFPELKDKNFYQSHSENHQSALDYARSVGNYLRESDGVFNY